MSAEPARRRPSPWPPIIFVCFILVASAALYALLRDPAVRIKPRFAPDGLVFAADGSALGANDGFGADLYALPEYASVIRIPFSDHLHSDVVAWKSDLSQIALAAGTGTSIEIRDVRSNAVVRSLPSDAPGEIILDQGPNWTSSTPAPDALLRLAWSPDGRFLAILRYSGALQVWDLEANATIAPPSLARRFDGCLAWSADSQRLLFSDNEGQLRSYGAPDFTDSLMFEANDYCTLLAVHPNGKLMAQRSEPLSMSRGPTVEVWAMGTLSRMASHKADDATRLAWHPTEEVLAIASGGRLELWRPFDDEVVVLAEDDDDRILAIAFSPDGRQLLVSTDDDVVRALPLAERAPELFP